MTLSETARKRLADVVALQPTKNGELMERWGMDDGSDVHRYLESELADYYYRDDDSLIRATDEAADLVDVEPGITDADDGGVPDRIRVPRLQARMFEVLAGPDDRSQSVVSVLQDLREAFDVDPSADEARAALRGLRRKGVVETVYRTVPTYRRTVGSDEVTVDVAEEASA
ncbi:MAG: DUF5797 family protein [Halobacteriales archaeon]